MCLAVPGRVISIHEVDGARMGKVDFGGIVKEVCLEFVPEIEVGDYAIVHVGFAISRMDEASARQTLEMFASLGLPQDELEPGWPESPGAQEEPDPVPGQRQRP